MAYEPNRPSGSPDAGGQSRYAGAPTDEAAQNPHGNVGAYVVDALEPPERAEFRAHLDTCASCRREVAEFAETAAEMARLVETTPPPTLRRSTLAAIGNVRPLPPAVPPAIPPAVPQPATGDVAPLDDHPSVMPWSLSLGAPPETEPARRVRRGRSLPIVATVVVAAVCAVLLFLGGWLVGTLGHRAPQPIATQQSELLSAPDASLLSSTVNGASVSYLVSRDRDQAMLIASNLPAPAANQVYQLWILTGGRAAPAGLIRTGGSVQATFTGSLAGADRLAISAEPAPDGADRPGEPLSDVEI